MGDVVRSWDPGVTGIAEVLHARFVDHAYPLHTHDTWTLLPPHVPHDGRSRTPEGFRKRVLYLDADVLPPLAGRVVDDPELPDPAVARAVAGLHDALLRPEPLDVESRSAVLLEDVSAHLRRTRVPAVRDAPLAARLRELLDAHLLEGVSLAWAAGELHVSTAHLARTFTREIGMSPHAYLVGRRIDRARRLLLTGHRPADVAALAGFHDQAHLNRHFRRVLGTTPGRFARR